MIYQAAVYEKIEFQVSHSLDFIMESATPGFALQARADLSNQYGVLVECACEDSTKAAVRARPDSGIGDHPLTRRTGRSGVRRLF